MKKKCIIAWIQRKSSDEGESLTLLFLMLS